MGWDAFGLPAENAAKLNKLNPNEWTKKHRNYAKPIKTVGFINRLGSRNLNLQWRLLQTPTRIISRLFKLGLVSRKETYVNWDPEEQTVLANEQVINGRGWRSNAVVERKKLSQWFFNITKFSDALLNDLSKLDGWPDKVKLMQKNWIGKSFGCEINFQLVGDSRKIKVLLLGQILFLVPLSLPFRWPWTFKKFLSNKEFIEFKIIVQKMGTTEEALANAEKLGYTQVFLWTSIYKKEIPIYFANFVLMDYGTGAIFGCPAHDQRDFDFAKKYKLDILQVVSPSNKTSTLKEAYTGEGLIINSDFLNGFDVREAKNKIIDVIEKKESRFKKLYIVWKTGEFQDKDIGAVNPNYLFRRWNSSSSW